ncbi:MAG: amino acid permease [Myxococcota bacterium]|nr:amino acid permease [Myxococcota bacterium]
MQPGVSVRPTRGLRPLDAIAIIVGVVVGVGIFRAPSMVASGVESELGFIGLWALGGTLSLVGALCYCELVAAFPSAGGEYHFLHRAFGPNVSFLFAWARLTVIGTGSIALLAFVFGDYVSTLVPLGEHGSAIYAGAIVVALVGVNVAGLRFGSKVQTIVTTLLVLGVLVMAGAALLIGPAAPPPPPTTAATSTIGFAMVFVLLTYGGWNEAAYLSAEVRGGPRSSVLTLLAGVAAITAVYLLANLAYVHVLGLDGIRASQTVGTDTIAALTGSGAAHLVSALVATAALTSMNATLLTVSRTGYALGRDVHLLRWLGGWNDRAAAPVPALLAIGTLALALIGLGAAARRGFATMVEFTAPVFWAFFLLTGLAVFALRRQEPTVPRPFRVPLYPLTPLVFCATCGWLLHASLAYTRLGAIVGVVVLLLGVVPLWLARRSAPASAPDPATQTDTDTDTDPPGDRAIERAKGVTP